VTAGSSEGLVERLGRARLEGQPLADAGRLLPAEGSGDGYGIQAELAAWQTAHGRGELAGYKIGATAKGMQALLGVPGPVSGHILSGNVVKPGAAFACNPGCKPGVECEIAFRLGDDLAPASSPFTRDDVAARIDAVMPAIEIVENRYGDFRQCSTALLTADDFFHKACVPGAAVLDWRDIDLPATAGRTSVNGAWVETGRGREVLGNPLEAVVWLANKLARRRTGLKAGQIVLTGSMTPVHWIDALPSRIAIEISGLGASSVNLTDQS
jgi:2-keto-4-pentenoate hydratase